jgi:hypothetical protein
MYRHYDPKSESIEDAHIEPQPHQNTSQWTRLVSLVNGHDGRHCRHDGRHDAHDGHDGHHVHGLVLSMVPGWPYSALRSSLVAAAEPKQ